MTDRHSSTGIYHVVLGNVSSRGIFCDRADYKKFMELVKLYKAPHHIRLLGYALTPEIVHLALRDKRGQLDRFIAEIKETYRIYYTHKYPERSVFHQQVKVRAVETYEGFINLYRYIHQKGINSLPRFQDELRTGDNVLDVEYVLGALGAKKEPARNELLRVSEQEPPKYYQIQMKDMEFFREEKGSIRRRRAERFMTDFLRDRHLTLDELMDEDHFNARMALVKAFREETDLSFRDIGGALDLSHTTVIRIWRLAHERDLHNCIA